MRKFSPDDYVVYKDIFSLKSEDLSEVQRSFLSNLNGQLIKIEKNIKREAQRLIKAVEERIAKPNAWIDDFEIESITTSILREDDPAYRKDDDNVLVELWEYHKRNDWEWGIGDRNNHNEYTSFKHHSMKDEFHCWLYHCLYDHTEMGWVNILRIGSIWVDINIEYQKIIDI